MIRSRPLYSKHLGTWGKRIASRTSQTSIQKWVRDNSETSRQPCLKVSKSEKKHLWWSLGWQCFDSLSEFFWAVFTDPELAGLVCHFTTEPSEAKAAWCFLIGAADYIKWQMLHIWITQNRCYHISKIGPPIREKKMKKFAFSPNFPLSSYSHSWFFFT